MDGRAEADVCWFAFCGAVLPCGRWQGPRGVTSDGMVSISLFEFVAGFGAQTLLKVRTGGVSYLAERRDMQTAENPQE